MVNFIKHINACSKWSGLGMMIVQTSRNYDTDIDTLLANGFNQFREVPTYQVSGWLNASKAALLRNIPKGAKYIWGVSSNRFDNPAYVITPANYPNFRQAILDAALWAKNNNVYEFQIGNEEEFHIDPNPPETRQQRIDWIIGKMKEVAIEVKQIFTNGKISYSCAHPCIGDWVNGGKGIIDLLASNIYKKYGSEPTEYWQSEIDMLVGAFGKETYLTEFSISSTTPENYSVDEEVQAQGTAEMIEYIRASGMARAIFFVWYHSVYGGVLKDNGTYRKLWNELKLQEGISIRGGGKITVT